MITDIEYALFAANVYGNSALVRSEKNTIQIPNGWTVVASTGNSSTITGFMANAYKNSNGEIIISYAGTTNENILDWVTGNTAALGSSAQEIEAIKFYLDVLQQNPGANISFTGHSLGGGLASLMSVFFDLPAVVFDQAPFAVAADDVVFIEQAKLAMIALGYDLPASFTSYIPIISRIARQDNVHQIYIEGEVLSLTGGFNKIYGELTPIDPDAESNLNWGGGSPLNEFSKLADLHSMSLLTGFMLSEEFLTAAKNNPELLARLFKGLYQDSPKDNKTNLIDMLVQQEWLGENSLRTLANNVEMIDFNVGLTSESIVHVSGVDESVKIAVALIDVIFAGLYQQGKNRPINAVTSVFENVLQTVSGGLVINAAALGGERSKVDGPIREIIEALAVGVSYLAKLQDRWILQSGTSQLNYNSNDGLSDVVIGYTGNDTISSGGGNDILLGGSGNDVLTGGTGNDILVGGEGTDQYIFTESDLTTILSSDTIKDSDGQGSLVLPSDLSTIQRKSENSWVTADRKLFFQIVNTGVNQDLVIQYENGSRIVIEGWSEGELGISLNSAPYAPTPPASIPATAFDDVIGSYDGVHSPVVATDIIDGLSGNDLLDGGLGDDFLKGGDGDDVLLGGSGNNEISGGAGNDFIVSIPQVANFKTPPDYQSWYDEVDAGTRDDIAAIGNGWYLQTGDGLTYDPTAHQNLQLQVYQPPGGVAYLPAAPNGVDIVNGDAGNDFIDTARGNDVIDGGLDADTIYAGTDNDVVFGGEGNDFIAGGLDVWRLAA